MGLFSRKKSQHRGDMSPAVQPSRSNASLDSGGSSVRSPLGTSMSDNRASGGSTNPSTPMSPFPPANIPRIDMPRPPDPQLDPVGYLKSLAAVRERSKIVTDKALRNDLKHFDVDMDMFPHVVSFVARIIKVGDDAPIWLRPERHGSGIVTMADLALPPARLRRTLYEHTTPRSPPALLRWRTGPRCGAAFYIRRRRGHLGEVPADD